jgi:hypothetical protein
MIPDALNGSSYIERLQSCAPRTVASIRGGTVYSDTSRNGADLIFVNGETVTLLTPNQMRDRLARLRESWHKETSKGGF